jgi:hypothetical protein
MRGETSNI